MLLKLRNLFIKIYGYICNLYSPIKYARHLGAEIGEGCRIIGRRTVWGSEPYLIHMGNHVELSVDVAFCNHDGATWVLRSDEKYRKAMKFGEIFIGDNTFIGMRSTILPGVKIGKNCIVGACSLVTKDIPDGQVWGAASSLHM